MVIIKLSLIFTWFIKADLDMATVPVLVDIYITSMPSVQFMNSWIIAVNMPIMRTTRAGDDLTLTSSIINPHGRVYRRITTLMGFIYGVVHSTPAQCSQTTPGRRSSQQHAREKCPALPALATWVSLSRTVCLA